MIMLMCILIGGGKCCCEDGSDRRKDKVGDSVCNCGGDVSGCNRSIQVYGCGRKWDNDGGRLSWGGRIYSGDDSACVN